MRLAALLIAVTTTMALGLPADATEIAAGGITRGEVAAFLKSKGYPVTATKVADGQSILKATAPSGVNFDIYFYDCKDDGRCPSVQFAAGWTMPKPVPPERLNAWNRENQYMRAYVQDGGTLYGEIDMILAPGGTTEQLESYRLRWNTLLAKFKTHFGL